MFTETNSKKNQQKKFRPQSTNPSRRVSSRKPNTEKSKGFPDISAIFARNLRSN